MNKALFVLLLCGLSVSWAKIASGTIDQSLEHFQFDNTHTTFQQKYLVRDDYWKGDGSPIFLMIGPESQLPNVYVEDSLFLPLAIEMGGLVVSLEHRFYGESNPFPATDPGKLTVDQLKFLSSKHALADLAAFHEFIVEKYNAPNSKWVCAGGSYGGSLSAWFRMKYPHMVEGAVAVAAPMQWHPTPDYYNVVSKAVGPKCSSLLTTLFDTLNTMAADPQECKVLETEFAFLAKSINMKICGSSTTNQGVFVNHVGVNYILQASQFNYGIPFLFPEKFPMNAICQQLETVGDDVNKLVQEFASFAEQAYNFQHGKNNAHHAMKHLAIPSHGVHANASPLASLSQRPWLWQSCTELDNFNQYDNRTHFFTPNYNPSPSAYCKLIFPEGGIVPDPAWTQTLMGSRENIAKFSNILFTNGVYDPTLAVSVTKNVSDTIRAIVIPGVGHGGELLPHTMYPNGPASLHIAVASILQQVKCWIQPSLSAVRLEKEDLGEDKDDGDEFNNMSVAAVILMLVGTALVSSLIGAAVAVYAMSRKYNQLANLGSQNYGALTVANAE